MTQTVLSFAPIPAITSYDENSNVEFFLGISVGPEFDFSSGEFRVCAYAYQSAI